MHVYNVSATVQCVCVDSLLFVLGLSARRRVGSAHVETGVELALVRRL